MVGFSKFLIIKWSIQVSDVSLIRVADLLKSSNPFAVIVIRYDCCSLFFCSVSMLISPVRIIGTLYWARRSRSLSSSSTNLLLSYRGGTYANTTINCLPLTSTRIDKDSGMPLSNCSNKLTLSPSCIIVTPPLVFLVLVMMVWKPVILNKLTSSISLSHVSVRHSKFIGDSRLLRSASTSSWCFLMIVY